MLDIFSYSFMQRSLIMGIIIAIIAPTIGLFLVLRRLSVIGDAISHVALAGAAFGLLLGIYPVYTAIGFSIIAVLGVEKLRKEYSEYAELSLSIVLSAGIGLASILISLGNTSGIFSYLFGSLALVTKKDIWVVSILGSFIIISVLFLYKGLFYLTFDEESARMAGVPVRKINTFFSILVALTIGISMRTVGVLLISSLMILPVATSLLISKSFKQALLYSNLFGIISVVLGLISSFYFDLAPGGTIVLTALLILIIVMVINKIKD
ncbi:metal ABC transporter permease [Anaerosalibacter bizertensis]|uniref:Metal ABC transporter permease n=2 Tax=Anaerosalibacter bizertensis TaxID=932217 RepID=A0A844FI21_9FIRM|nr:metal ABC transporter permease [Anaerosalibacter bizertensis]MBV1818615.1 metal ABC transporter permease [Bacteroidales bacterium MSK.15.36]HHV26273.1 metal ABC transporter permease [Tissierellia bacterium]MCB5558684.1 metal ABC transporter permease [Anaerosalibacter bizertensis]MCG4583172.1 metal ABC transporter permease [Anaerosalibacter bizertensis]MSS43555.1 metal ABC transporter permease [Anaerosalibacter bizertensis]